MWCWFCPCCEASVPSTSILGPRQRWVSHPVFSLREISPFISSDERGEPRRTNEKTWWPRVAPNQCMVLALESSFEYQSRVTFWDTSQIENLFTGYPTWELEWITANCYWVWPSDSLKFPTNSITLLSFLWYINKLRPFWVTLCSAYT